MERNRKVYVLGHKNPDTDSICSAIAYAYLKNQTEGSHFVAKRAGQVNEETKFVLDYFGVDEPTMLKQVKPQVKDIEMRPIKGVSDEISLKKAWNLMEERDVVTLPITKGKKLEGLITIGDIATSYMAVYDSSILGWARTKYRNIIETIDGEMLVGNEHGVVSKGKVLVAAANPDLMEDYIKENDLVILGNRYESQLCAIEMNAACIIICEGAPASMTIKKLAEEKDCAVICSPHDTYTVARLINQSMPIKYFMHREPLITFEIDEPVESIKEVMTGVRHRDFPILDMDGNYSGCMISRRNLLSMKRKQLILVDHNEKGQAIDGIEETDILEIIDHHRLGSLETIAPVFFRNQPLGCTATIIYQMFIEKGVDIPKDIAGLLCSAIISDTLMFRSPTCTGTDEEAAYVLAGISGIDIRSYAGKMFKAGSNLSSKTPEEIFYQDFKKTSVGKITFGVGQVNALDGEELADIKERMAPYLEETFSHHGVSMLFFMLTNIIEEKTELLFYGENVNSIVEKAFHIETDDGNACILEDVVSRKKQVIPALVVALQN